MISKIQPRIPSFSQSLEQFFLTVGQNNFGNKIPIFKNDITTFSFSLMSKNGGFIQSKKFFIYREIWLCTLRSWVPNKCRISIDWFYLWVVSSSRFHSGLKLCPNQWGTDDLSLRPKPDFFNLRLRLRPAKAKGLDMDFSI